ncbi:MAG: hypothetical protein JO214_18010 [Frankiaceae bacterium]|nr:hypothetical protein [Frankiaceae bacterium]
MSAIDVERIPTTWDDSRDDAFFRIAAQIFPPTFVEIAGALLASFDRDADPTDRLIDLTHEVSPQVTRALGDV